MDSEIQEKIENYVLANLDWEKQFGKSVFIIRRIWRRYLKARTKELVNKKLQEKSIIIIQPHNWEKTGGWWYDILTRVGGQIFITNSND